MGCCSTNEKSLIVTTINPIWRSRPVHPGTERFTFCSLKSKENIIFAHNYFRKTNTNQASHCSDFYLSIATNKEPLIVCHTAFSVRLTSLR